MTGARWKVLLSAIALFAAAVLPAAAQTVQFWPEVDAFVRLNPKSRLLLVATNVQEEGEKTDAEFGGSLEFRLKPIRRAPGLMFRVDESKNSVLTIRGGYRYLPSYSGGSSENRVLVDATVRYPLTRHFAEVLASSRNQLDVRVIDGTYSWRFRNRLSLERELSIGRVRISPYGRFELFYDSRFSAFSKTETMLGAAFPITRRLELESYYDYQLDTGNSPNRKTRAIGSVATFHF